MRDSLMIMDRIEKGAVVELKDWVNKTDYELLNEEYYGGKLNDLPSSELFKGATVRIEKVIKRYYKKTSTPKDVIFSVYYEEIQEEIWFSTNMVAKIISLPPYCESNLRSLVLFVLTVLFSMYVMLLASFIFKGLIGIGEYSSVVDNILILLFILLATMLLNVLYRLGTKKLKKYIDKKYIEIVEGTEYIEIVDGTVAFLLIAGLLFIMYKI